MAGANTPEQRAEAVKMAEQEVQYRDDLYNRCWSTRRSPCAGSPVKGLLLPQDGLVYACARRKRRAQYFQTNLLSDATAAADAAFSPLTGTGTGS